ncbi:putative scf ubiquitin ligase subunit [Phaeomoniella chlamydospora]|uniref:Putative scf ubiquitin ligase subunit n=1 Tax=Phaeomoniella chlamydospora TaxID=158046 RepID=A0A0G2HHT6_PHACM|nr:putative scf ubiquitin ligase subunit [Phaeomoniella chlamydospora]
MLARGRGKIRAPRRGLAARDDNVDFDSTWTILSNALDEIHRKKASGLSFEELYRAAYKLVLKKRGDELYGRVKDFEEQWLGGDVRTSIMALVNPSLTGAIIGSTGDGERRLAGERFMAGVKDAYQNHTLCMSMITDVLMYMDRVYCADQRRPSIYTTAMFLFYQHVLRSPLTDDGEGERDGLDILESVMLNMIDMERGGETIDRSLIHACVLVLEGLYETLVEDETQRVYVKSFEPRFIRASEEFYTREGQELLKSSDASTFCRQAKRRITEEEQRCQQCLSISTIQKVRAVVDERLIKANIKNVIDMEGTGVKNMLDHDRQHDLAIVYELNMRVDPRKTALNEAMQKRVIELGKAINESAIANPVESADSSTSKVENGKAGSKKSAEKPINQQTVAAIKWVDEVLALKDKYYRIWESAFKKDQSLEKGLEHSFQEFININNRSSEHLSLFLDEYLKKGVKGKTDAEIDQLLDNGITLLQYISDKDLFETYYKKHLSKRLLMKRSASMDAERQMISKMKMKAGSQFTQKLEAMFKDMTISDDLTASYKSHVANLGDAGETSSKRIDLEVSVLTSTMWPIESMTRANQDGTARAACNFPPAVDKLRNSFEKFYLDKHSGRALSWQANMGTADVRATFKRPNGKVQRHELNVSTYAMVILLLFNDLQPGESLAFEEIQAQTNIPSHDLIRNLQSLAIAPKTRVLKKEPMSKDIKPADRFFFNEEFQSQYVKIKIGVVSSSGNKVENADERRETEKRANEERGGAIEAAVVRIMKQRKELAHSQLISEVVQQLSSRFQPDIPMVKKRIESLIDREYLERTPNAAVPSYTYLA